MLTIGTGVTHGAGHEALPERLHAGARRGRLDLGEAPRAVGGESGARGAEEARGRIQTSRSRAPKLAGHRSDQL